MTNAELQKVRREIQKAKGGAAFEFDKLLAVIDKMGLGEVNFDPKPAQSDEIKTN